jgi:hypothetical protein
MRFMIGVIVAGVIVVGMNVVLIRTALQVDGHDGVEASYEAEAR